MTRKANPDSKPASPGAIQQLRLTGKKRTNDMLWTDTRVKGTDFRDSGCEAFVKGGRTR